MCSLLVRTHRGPSCGDVEPGSIRHKSVLGGIQLTVLFYQRGEGGDRLREAALLHPVHMQVVMHVSLLPVELGEAVSELHEGGFDTGVVGQG